LQLIDPSLPSAGQDSFTGTSSFLNSLMSPMQPLPGDITNSTPSALLPQQSSFGFEGTSSILNSLSPLLQPQPGDITSNNPSAPQSSFGAGLLNQLFLQPPSTDLGTSLLQKTQESITGTPWRGSLASLQDFLNIFGLKTVTSLPSSFQSMPNNLNPTIQPSTQVQPSIQEDQQLISWA
jgi:hypothetical protein